MADIFPQRCFKRKKVEISPCFFIFTQKVIHYFPAHIFPNLLVPGYPRKASYFEHRLCHNFFSGDNRARIIEINCTDGNYFLCDRVCTQRKKPKQDILVAFDLENVVWKMVYNLLGIDETT